MSSTLYRKYRPAQFSQVVGQRHIVRTLSNAISYDRVAQAYLFTGPRGTGKTTLARIFAKTVNCTSPQEKNKKSEFLSPCLKCPNCLQSKDNNSPDIIEIDAASNTGVDNIRELRETAKLSPHQGKFKIYIIDEVHMLSSGAFNALLKILEEPPSHIIFILATTEIQKVPETIISRCQKFDFAKFNIDEIVGKLSEIIKKEKLSVDTDALELIAIAAEGGMRDAESILEQVITLEKDKITSAKVALILGTGDTKSLEDLTQMVFTKQTSEALLLINKIYRDGVNLELLAKSWLEYLRKIMLFSVDPKIEKKVFAKLTQEQKAKIKTISENTSLELIIKYISQVSNCIPKIKESFIPQLPLESLIVELTKDIDIKSVIQSQNTPTTISTAPISKTPLPKKETSPTPEVKKEISVKETETIVEIPTETAVVEELPASEEITPELEAPAKINIYEVEKKWKMIIAELEKTNCSLAMMLSNSIPVESSRPNVVNIVIRHGFQKDLINKVENRLTIADISNKIIGLVFRIEAVTEEESGIKLKKVLPELTPEMIAGKCGLGNNSQESLLSDAMSLMGGKVVTNE